MAKMGPSRKKVPRKKGARREATQAEKRLYAKQFAQAKTDEYKSWAEENDIFDLVDCLFQTPKIFITGRWGCHGDGLTL